MDAKKTAVCWLALPLVAACGGGGGGLGPGTGVQQTPTAAEVFVSLAAGSEHTCAISSSHRAYCWGANGSGQLGNGKSEGSTTPALVLASKFFFSVVAGDRHSCASNGTVFYCWGDNSAGQLGNGRFETSNVPTLVERTPLNDEQLDFLGIASGPGGDHTCAASSREIMCWGSNRFGQLGTDASPYSAMPLLVAKPADSYPYFGWNDIAAGASHSCILLEEGSAWCWGDNSAGQLGRAGVAASAVPLLVRDFQFAHLSAGGAHTCGVTRSATIAQGQTACWGANAFGQLGNGTTTSSFTPVYIGTPVFRNVVAGVSHTCGITDVNELFCWGSNSRGQLGIGGNTNALVPTLVRTSASADAHFVAVALGKEHTCAISDTHKTYCWGSNASGQLGTGTAVDSNVPVLVANIS